MDPGPLTIQEKRNDVYDVYYLTIQEKGFHVVFLRHIPWEANELRDEDIASSSFWETRSNSYSISSSINSGMVVSRQKRGLVVKLNNMEKLKLCHTLSLFLLFQCFPLVPTHPSMGFSHHHMPRLIFVGSMLN